MRGGVACSCGTGGVEETVVQPVFFVHRCVLFFTWTLKLNLRALHSAIMFHLLQECPSVCEEHPLYPPGYLPSDRSFDLFTGVRKVMFSFRINHRITRLPKCVLQALVRPIYYSSPVGPVVLPATKHIQTESPQNLNPHPYIVMIHRRP